MVNHLKRQANRTYTENGALTNISSFSDCLDLFATIGGMRHCDESEVISRFSLAYAENPDIAMKILFYSRDIREGLGERRTFRIIIKWIANNRIESAKKNLRFIKEFGRWDDTLELIGTLCEEELICLIAEQLRRDKQGENVSLLAKWLPSINTSKKETRDKAKYLANKLGMSFQEYRKTISDIRKKINIIENNLRKKDYSFEYEKQPSKAMLKYRKAFIRNDHERYDYFLEKVKKEETSLNVSTLMPYEILSPFFNRIIDVNEWKSIEATWNAQAASFFDKNEIVVVDGSESMYLDVKPRPIAVAISLALYFAERNKGFFSNHFITFSEQARLVEIKGNNLLDKLQYCISFNEVANTNIQSVFRLILDTAIYNKVGKNEMPKTIYIISDMEFDYCTEDAELTNFELAKRNFEIAGYNLPQVVFWNVASRRKQLPVTMNEQGVMLVSGCSPKVFSMTLKKQFSPYRVMMDIIGSERYAEIIA